MISLFWGMNKQLWPPSYLFFMAGACGLLLVALYIVYDLQIGESANWVYGQTLN